MVEKSQTRDKSERARISSSVQDVCVCWVPSAVKVLRVPTIIYPCAQRMNVWTSVSARSLNIHEQRAAVPRSVPLSFEEEHGTL